MPKPCRYCGKTETPNGGRCPECRREYQRQYREKRKSTHPDYFKSYYRENREKRQEEARDYAREHAKANRQRVKEWRLANPERSREAHRRKRTMRPEHYKKLLVDWLKANPDKARAIQDRRRTRKRNAFVADVILSEIIARDEGRCGICGDPVMGPLHLDHIIPLAAGGTHEPDNVQLAHPTCNLRKGASYEAAA